MQWKKDIVIFQVRRYVNATNFGFYIQNLSYSIITYILYE